jgi:pilus assembly protein CpaC
MPHADSMIRSTALRARRIVPGLPALLFASLSGVGGPSHAQSADAPRAGADPIVLHVGEAHVLEEPGLRRIAVGNGRVIQATALDDRQVLVLTESPGQSSVLLWGRSGPPRSVSFTVLPADTARVLQEVRALLGGSDRVGARLVGEKVVIEGADVSEAVSARVAEAARRYPQVVNLLPRLGQERMIAIDVKFIEVRRELLEHIGLKWSDALKGPTFQVIGDLHRSDALRPGGAAAGSGLQVAPRIAPFASSLSIATSLSSMINLLVQSGDAAILAEPRLSCRSGGSARFVAGGELPIPVSGALGTASVAFKEYGVKFDVSPVASESGLIAAKIATEISSINFEVAVKEVPGLTKRRAETDVNLRENETLVIAGLLTDESARNVDRLAGASELPVLGPLFRSRQFRDRQTELVVFVTPRFVDGAPMPADAAAVGVAPMRAPNRLLPAIRADAGGPTGVAEDPQSAPLPAGGAPAGSSGAGSPHRLDAARDPDAETDRTEDRGTSRRWRSARDRLRMVD